MCKKIYYLSSNLKVKPGPSEVRRCVCILSPTSASAFALSIQRSVATSRRRGDIIFWVT